MVEGEEEDDEEEEVIKVRSKQGGKRR